MTGPPTPVLLIAPQPFFRTAGTPYKLLQTCRALSAQGYAVHVLTLPLGDDVDLPGLTVERVAPLPWPHRVPIGFSLAKLAYNVRLWRRARALLSERPSAAVHAVEEAAFYAVHLARRRGVPAVVDLHSDLAEMLGRHPKAPVRLLAAPAAWLRRQALRRAAHALAVAPGLAEVARRAAPATPVSTVLDAVPEEMTHRASAAETEALRAALGLAGERLVVYTGNFERRQGVALLVRAMALVGRAVPRARLLLVGGEPEEVAAIEALARDVGAPVRCVGARPAAEMPAFMALADVLVSPRLEPVATPLKIYAYMASGRPIVATDLPTHRAVLDEASAVLVRPDADGLAAGIGRVLADPGAAAALGAEARRRGLREHGVERYAREMAEVYASVLGAEPLPADEQRRAA